MLDLQARDLVRCLIESNVLIEWFPHSAAAPPPFRKECFSLIWGP